MRQILVFIATIFVCVGFARPAIATPVAYLAIVGVGKGNGVFGHAFVLIRDSARPIITSDTYQYNISTVNGQPLTITGTLNNSNLLFTSKKEKFHQMLGRYTSVDNRTVTIYELNLSEKEVATLVTALEADFRNANFAQEHPYGPYNNCVSRILELLNQVVTAERQIEYLGTMGVSARDQVGFRTQLQGAFLNRFPFILAKVLETHPISKGRVKIYEKQTSILSKFYQAIRKDLELMAHKCSWSANTLETSQLLVAHAAAEGEAAPLKPVFQLISGCSEANAHRPALGAKIFQLFDEKDTTAKEEIYQWMSTRSSP